MTQHASAGPLVAGLVGSALALSGLAPVTASAAPGRNPGAKDGGAVTRKADKLDTRVGARVRPTPVHARRTDTRVKIRVRVPGKSRRPGGHVQVAYQGWVETARLRKGATVLHMGKWPSAGQKRVQIRYLGNYRMQSSSKVLKFKVRKR